jgi:ribulose-phosphate 3-epimerase
VSWSEWSRRVEVEPSVYAGNFACLGSQLESLLGAGATIFHFDVGDGHFVPEITMGPIVLKSIAELVHRLGGVFDCHLMVEDPAQHFGPIREAGGDSVTFHLEARGDPADTIARARDMGLAVGVAFNPETRVERAVATAQGADLVTCMSIHPGLSGAQFMPEAIDRIAELRRLLPDDVFVQVDGGVHLDNVAAVRAAGADLLISGSGVFWNDDPATAYGQLVSAVAAENREEGQR